MVKISHHRTTQSLSIYIIYNQYTCKMGHSDNCYLPFITTLMSREFQLRGRWAAKETSPIKKISPRFI